MLPVFIKKMSNQKKFLFSLIIALAIFLFFSKSVLAQVVINEFSSSSNPEWVEIYNSSGGEIDLTGWKIIDDNSNTSDDLDLSGCIISSGFRSFSRPFGWLNNGGDTITLKDENDAQINQIVYGSGGVVGVPNDGQSASRQPDGSDSWLIIDSSTQQDDYCQPAPTSTPTSTPTLTLSPTTSPTSTPTSKPESTSTPTPALAATPTLKPTPKPTSTPKLTPTPTEEVSEEDSFEEVALFESPEPSPEVLGEETSSDKSKIWPKVFLVGGLALLFGAGFWVWYTQLRKDSFGTQNEKEDKIID